MAACKVSDIPPPEYMTMHLAEGVSSEHCACQFLVIDLEHDPHASAMLRTYAKLLNEEHPAAAHWLKSKAHEIERRNKHIRDEAQLVRQGLADVAAGRVLPLGEVKWQMKKKKKKSKRK